MGRIEQLGRPDFSGVAEMHSVWGLHEHLPGVSAEWRTQFMIIPFPGPIGSILSPNVDLKKTQYVCPLPVRYVAHAQMFAR